ncbi:MAG: restriction endonuclease subunit S [Nitrospirae bacterium]|nr:restriction endonuclease subunit S [Nitrospirota bacterium]
MSGIKWNILHLGDKKICLEIRPGFACGLKDTQDGVPHLRMNNITTDGQLSFSLIRRIPRDIADKQNRWLQIGDVIFCNTNSTDLVGKSCLFSGWNEQCTYSNHLTRLRSNPDHLEPRWLSLCLQQLWTNRYFALNCREFVGQSAFSNDNLKFVEIPVPPLNEQRRIVARIETLTRRFEEARMTSMEREIALDVLLQSLYTRMIDGVEWKPLTEVAALVRRAIKTTPHEEYEEMGIRSFGKGTFRKPILTGKQIGNKRIYRINEGDLVFNNVFAWEKAIAVTQKEDHGRVGSHRFITYVPHDGKATSEFLCHHFLSERGIEDIRAASPGSAGRNRTLGLKKLELIAVPVPDYSDQVRFAEIAKRRQLIQIETSGVVKDMKSFTSALLAKAFRGEL